MLAVDFTLYRFVCDLATFTGLFSADDDGRRIPDTAAFVCCWSRVPRAKQTTLNPAQIKQHGTSSPTFFKSLGSDMALTFASAQSSLSLNGDATVLTFQIRPTEFEGGDIPVVAKGTLDPVPYFGKPKKNYAIKLRDASGQVIGKLLFSLEVEEVEENTQEDNWLAGPNGQTSHASSAVSADRAPAPRPSSAENGGMRGHGSRPHSARSDSTSSETSRTSSSHSGASSRRSHHSHRSNASSEARASPVHSAVGERAASPDDGLRQPALLQPSEHIGLYRPVPTRPNVGEAPTPAPCRVSSVVVPAPALTTSRPAAPLPGQSVSTTLATSDLPTMPSQQRPPAATGSFTEPQHGALRGLVVSVERIGVKPESIDLNHPAPLLLECEYYLKLRCGAYTFYTTPVVCRSPKEVVFGGEQAYCDLSAVPPGEKLRFSLWENKKQVAGFSLDHAKFRVEAGKTKEYAIPFRYQPTQQSACLDVGVRLMTRQTVPTSAGSSGVLTLEQAVESNNHTNLCERPHRQRTRSPHKSPSSHHSHSRRRHGSVRSGRSSVSSHHSSHRHHRTADVTAPPVAAPALDQPTWQPRDQRPSAPPAPPPPHSLPNHIDAARPPPLSLERRRSVTSPLPRPTGYGEPVASSAALPRPVPAANQQVSSPGVATPATMPTPPRPRAPPQIEVLSLMRSTLSDVNGGADACVAAPRLVPRRGDTTPGQLGLPDTPRRDDSRERATPLRSLLPRAIDGSRNSREVSAFVSAPSPVQSPRGLVASPRGQAASPRTQAVSQRVAASSPPRPLQSKNSSILSEYIERVESQKSQNEDIIAARRESASRRRQTPQRHPSRTHRRGEEGSRPAGMDSAARSTQGSEKGHRRRRRSGSSHGHRRRHTAAMPPPGVVVESSEHELYLAQVMARLNQQSQGPAQRASLVEEWLGWRGEASQRNSRCNSVTSDRARTPSVAGSVVSRDESVGSIFSRRATPLPTKSFANCAMQSPYQPEYSRPRRPTSVTSWQDRPPLI